MPITSPVDRISGPSTVSTPGKRANGNTDSLTPTWPSLPVRKRWVPDVPITLKPSECSSRTASAMRVLSLSRTETNTVPLRGTRVPPPSWLFANATSKERSMPMTSPVERISGPSTVSTPGKRANGKTDFFHADMAELASSSA